LYWLAVYFDLIRDCYEAFVIYNFFSLLLEFLGGYRNAKDSLSTRPVKMVVPLCCITIPPNRGIIRTCKRLVLQYVVIRPVVSVICVIMQTQGVYCPGNWAVFHGYLYTSIVMFCSVTVAMYGLLLTYTATHTALEPFKPVPKFLSIKFVIFLSFWQSIIVAIFVQIGLIHATTNWTAGNVSEGVQDVLTICEMLIAAVWHMRAYPWNVYAKHEERTNVLKSLFYVLHPRDVAEDIMQSFVPAPKKGSSEVNGTEMDKTAIVVAPSPAASKYGAVDSPPSDREQSDGSILVNSANLQTSLGRTPLSP